MKILSLSLFGILLVFTTATGSAYTSINIQLFQIAEAQLTNNNNNTNNNADVSLVSQRAYSDEYSFHIVGEVQNTGPVSAEFVEIVASFYDGNGQFVGTSYTFTNPTTVSPAMKAPFDIQLLTDDKIVKESKNYQLTLSWMNQGGKEMVKQYKSADLRQGQLQGQQQQQQEQQSSFPIGINNNTLSQTTEETTATTTDVSFGAKALQFLTYCNNQFSQTPVNSMTTDTLVFCTMVYDWYLIGCNSNDTVLAPIITAAQCNDPVIIQQVNNYKTQIDIRLKQIVKIEVLPPGDGGGGNGKPHSLTILITIAKDPIIRGNVQTITVTVSDTKSHEKIEGAKVNGKVQYVTGHIETFSCTTDSSGMCSHSWRISGDAKPGTFPVSVEASAPGFKSASETSSFQVIAKNENATLPIVNDTFVNDTTGVMPNDTGTIGNETGFSGGQGDTGSDNDDNATLPIPPDPCLEDPSLPECTTVTPQALISNPCIDNPSAEGCPLPEEDPCKTDPTAEGCEPAPDPCIENPNAEGCEPPAPPPPPIDTDANDDDADAGDTDTDGDDSGDDSGGGEGGGGDSGDSSDSGDGNDDGGDTAKPT